MHSLRREVETRNKNEFGPKVKIFLVIFTSPFIRCRLKSLYVWQAIHEFALARNEILYMYY